jgi:hypothetical protein
LSADEFAGFLKFENNRHWWGIARESDRLLPRMAAVRAMLDALLDEERPIEDRIDELGDLPGFTPDVFTPILLICHPESYGVWSSISESAMRRLGLWPDLDEPVTRGSTYRAVNEMLRLCAAEVDTDLWTLDALWWAAEKEHDPGRHFVRAGRSSRPAVRPAATVVRRSPAPRANSTRPATPAEDTFVCERCFTTKLRRLESDRANVCVDCA